MAKYRKYNSGCNKAGGVIAFVVALAVALGTFALGVVFSEDVKGWFDNTPAVETEIEDEDGAGDETPEDVEETPTEDGTEE